MRILSAILAAGVLAACREAPPPPPSTEVVAHARPALPTDPDDVAWQGAPVFVSPLILQDMVEPRSLEITTTEVRVRAASDGTRLAFRLEWLDPTRDDELRPGEFSDACAVQLPAAVQPDVPAPQMGEGGKPVEITFWRAAWQAAADGRAPELSTLYPNASIDHYPFEGAGEGAGGSTGAQRELSDLYSPARALGNDQAARARPVQELVAAGPGTLAPGPDSGADGRGRRTERGWAVVISRALPRGLATGGRTQVAFAVWEGSHGDVGARKMRTGWVPLVLPLVTEERK